MKICIPVFVVFVASMTACWADADGPDAWQVHGVKEGGSLNMRKGPSKSFSVILRLPNDAKNLKNLGCFPEFNTAEWAELNARERRLASALRWCRVSFKNNSGWVYAQYLQEY